LHVKEKTATVTVCVDRFSCLKAPK